MAAVDPQILARAKAQIESHPLYQQLTRGRGRAQAGGAIDPRQFGVDYLPPGYVYSLGSRQVVNQNDYADKLFPAVGAGLLGAGVLGAAGVGPLAGGSAPAAGGAAFDALPAISSAEGAANAASLGWTLPGSAPLGGVGVGTAAAGAGAEAARRGVGGFLKDLATPENAAGLAALIAGLATNRNGNEQTEETKRINAITEARMRRADPLHQVAVSLAFGRLPTNYRQGVQMNNVPLPG